MSNLSAMLQLFDQGKQAGFFSEARKRVLDNFFQTDHGHARLFYRNLLSALSSFFFLFFSDKGGRTYPKASTHRFRHFKGLI